MHAQRDNSTLIALREVRLLETERRRQESEQREQERQRASALVEEARLAEAREREAEALAARQREESLRRDDELLRLGLELNRREREMERLRRECAEARNGFAASVIPPPSRSRRALWTPWVGCGLLLGALVLTLGWPGAKVPAAGNPEPIAVACPAPPSERTEQAYSAPPTPSTSEKTAPTVPPPQRQRKKPVVTRKPEVPVLPVIGARKPPECDGTDPLCGLPGMGEGRRRGE